MRKIPIVDRIDDKLFYDLITNPNSFFETTVDSFTLSHSFVIVLLTGLVLFTVPVIIVTWGAANLAGGLANFAYLGMIVSGLVYFISLFVMWFVNTGIFYTVTLLFDGEGDFRTLLQYTGWGYVPTLASAVLISVTVYHLVHQFPSPESISGMVAFQQKLQTNAIYFNIKLIAVVFELWRGFLWVFAVKHARNITQRQSVLTVAIPVILSVFWNLGNLTGLV